MTRGGSCGEPFIFKITDFNWRRPNPECRRPAVLSSPPTPHCQKKQMGKLHFPSWFQKIFHMKHKRSANTTPSNDDDPNILLLMNNLHHIQEKLDHALQLNLMYEKKVQQLMEHNDRLNQRLRDLKERHKIEKQHMERRMEDKEQEAKLLRNDLQKSHQENKYFKDGLVSLSKHVGNLSFKLNEEVNRRTLTMDKRGSK